MRRKTGIFSALLFIVATSLSAQAFWAQSYGVHPRYQLPVHITGFAAVETRETGALEIARTQAMDDLVRKVRVSIRSEVITTSRDDGTRASASYSNLTRSSSELDIANPQFLIDRTPQYVYAFVYVRVDAIAEAYVDSIRLGSERLSGALPELAERLGAGSVGEANALLGEVERALEQLSADVGVLRALGRLAPELELSVEGRPLRAFEADVLQLEETTRGYGSQLAGFTPQTYEQLVDLAAGRLGDEDIVIANIMPLRFETTDFSSPFGLRFAQAVADRIRETSGTPAADTGNAILDGSYWVDDDELELTVRLRSPETGAVLRSARLTVPTRAAGTLELQPSNTDGAIASQSLLIGDAIVDGGIAVEVWTDKGRDQEVLVFEEGDTIQFYFRVNQPAYLQMTYQLSSGDMVLLEREFYIGSDRVNRIVELPYQFYVVPPFGVERLVVTASSQPPPPPDTVIRSIDGQQYEVFETTEAAVVRTRGLARVPPDEREAAVGEATLTMTTVARER